MPKDEEGHYFETPEFSKMPELREAIGKLELLSEAGIIDLDERDALKFAISKLSLLEQVEKGGVEKLELICPKCKTSFEHYTESRFYKSNCYCWREDTNIRYTISEEEIKIHNRVIDLSNAHWVKKLEGIEEVIINNLNLNPPALAQAIMTYLKKEE